MVQGDIVSSKPMAVTAPTLHPKITNGLVSGAGPEIGIGARFRARPVTILSSLSSMATPLTLNALFPSRNNLFFLKAGLTRRGVAGLEEARFSTRLIHRRISGSAFRVSAVASAAEEQSSSSGVSFF